MSANSFDAKATLTVGDRSFQIFRLDALQSKYDVARLPFSLKILLENLLRNEDGESIRAQDIEALARWNANDEPSQEIAFTPARVVMQDFTGVPAIVDLAAMRDAMSAMGGDPEKINPLVPAELVIDHSVQVDAFGTAAAFQINAEREFERNKERYAFLRWGQGAFHNFKVVPPDTGIVHQVNLEYLARVVFVDDKRNLAYPDTLVGTDSHTTMINGLGVLGWGVGGIEAEAAMLGQPMSMLIPQVLGFNLHGKLPEGATATDLVLTVTEMLRQKGVVGKFVEFHGGGLAGLPLADRATIGNMSPEFGSTCAIFPIDAETLRYLEFSGRPPELIALVEAYAKEQGLWHDDHSEAVTYSDELELDLADVVPSIAGPKRPQDRVSLTESKAAFRMALEGMLPDDDGEDDAIADSFPASDPVSTHVPNGDGHGPHGGTGGAQRAGDPGGRHRDRARPRPRRDRGDHQLHEHVEPVGDARRRDPGPKCGPEGPEGEAVGEDLARPGLEGGHRVSRSRRADGVPRRARLQPGRVWLHHLHRQQRAAARRDLPGRERLRSRGGQRAERQPQLRGPDQPRREDELPRLAAAVRRLRAGREHGRRPLRGPAG
jgi:aconitate hydratase